MNPRDDLIDEQVRRSAPPNVTIVSSVPFDQIPAVFSKAKVLVNTSSLEGFPNTYLQAALSRVPIASLVVEPEFLAETRSGLCAAGNLIHLAEYISAAWRGDSNTDPEFARKTVISRHSLRQLVGHLAKLLQEFADEFLQSQHTST